MPGCFRAAPVAALPDSTLPDKLSKMSKLTDERIKLSATFLNAIAVAVVVAGAIVPLAAFTYGLPGAARGSVVAVVGFGWAVAGLALHGIARWQLRRLTP